jgi:hypothetical protein
VALLAACGVEEEVEGQNGATTPDATASPWVSPSPSPELAEAGPMTCVFPKDTKAFRLTVATWAWGGSGASCGRNTYNGSWKAFDGLPADTEIEYSYVLPDRVSAFVFQGGRLCCSWVHIGPRRWRREAGSTEWIEPPAFEDYTPFSPQALCEYINDLLQSDLVGVEGEKEMRNGIETVHYRISKDSSTEGPSGEDGPPRDTQWESTYDVWLATDGNWPVRVVYEVKCRTGLLDECTTVDYWEVRDLNDPSVTVEPPR